MTTVRPLGYAAMRLAGSAAALRAFLRRWGIFLGIAVMAFGAGSNSPGQSAAALAAWSVTPIFVAAGSAWLAPAALLQALTGLGLLYGMRSMLWPMAWAQAERALPIAAGQRLRSDATVVTLALLPLVLVEGLGAATLFALDPAELHAGRHQAIAALVLARLASLVAGVAMLQRRRRGPAVDRLRRRGVAAIASRGDDAPTAAPIGSFRALLWWPICHGPAVRTRQAMWLATGLLFLPGLALLRWPYASGWACAAFSLMSLMAVTRVATLSNLELGALLRACAALPVKVAVLQRARAALVLMCLIPGGFLFFAAVVAGPTGEHVRPVVLGLYAAVWLVGTVAEARAAPTMPSTKVSRWLLSAAALATIGSEVIE